MANYHKDNISLSEAMTMELNQLFRNWRTSGAQVPFDGLPDNATWTGTSVSKDPDGKVGLHIHFTVPDESPFCVATIASFSTLEELKEKFPNLFELTGYLFAFG